MKLTQVREKLQLSTYHAKFQSFLDEMASKDTNWKFLKQFVFEDILAYISLFLAIRSGSWELRVASIKLMAPIFTAFDHQNYRKLIAQHLAYLHTFPDEILTTFQENGFVASLSGRPWHSVALDEAYEVKINKECKTSIVHLSREYLNQVASYISYRAKCMENLRKQLFPEENCTCAQSLPTSILSKESHTKKRLGNINAQRNLILSAKHLQSTTTNQRYAIFFQKTCNSEQQHGYLQFRSIEQDEFERHVAYYILNEASVHPPLWKKRLLTLSPKKTTWRQVKQLEKDKKMVQKCLHKKLKWSKQMGRPIDKIAEQYVPIPLALADSNGLPLKGQKSNTTKSLKAEMLHHKCF